MCGIAGVLFSDEKILDRGVLESVSLAMAHRGPDGGGFYSEKGFSLIHRLLRIFSTHTKPGPYLDKTGRFLLSFNGEIYNYKEVAKEIGIPQEHVESDAEIFLEGWAQRGEKILRTINGMFAFAIFDKRERILYLGRDTLGEKPLYLHKTESAIFFASEVKALKGFGLRFSIHKQAISEYFQYRYISGEKTAFEGVEKVLPGQVLAISRNLRIEKKQFWSFPKTAEKLSYSEALPAFRATLEDSIRLRSSYRGAGIFLSGGIDSCSIANYLPTGTHSFTFFDERTKDERVFASDLAKHKGFIHQEIPLGDEKDLLDQAILAIEEPLGDSIILPAMALAKNAAKKTRVVFSGEGADEILGGYVHHLVMHRLDQISMRFGRGGLLASSKALKIFGQFLGNIPVPYPAFLGTEGIERLISVLQSRADGHYNSSLSSLFQVSQKSERSRRELEANSFEDFRKLDLETWLPNYSLLRLDKTLMFYGVEGRLPFLDKRLVELSFALPREAFFHRNQRKRILRDSVLPFLGKKVAYRKKVPFILDLSKKNSISSVNKRTTEMLLDMNLLNENILKQTVDAPPFLREKRVFSMENLGRWIELFDLKQ
jgi:asparagine synthase (glutamine-hydrolysing)